MHKYHQIDVYIYQCAYPPHKIIIPVPGESIMEVIDNSSSRYPSAKNQSKQHQRQLQNLYNLKEESQSQITTDLQQAARNHRIDESSKLDTHPI